MTLSDLELQCETFSRQALSGMLDQIGASGPMQGLGG